MPSASTMAVASASLATLAFVSPTVAPHTTAARSASASAVGAASQGQSGYAGKAAMAGAKPYHITRGEMLLAEGTPTAKFQLGEEGRREKVLNPKRRNKCDAGTWEIPTRRTHLQEMDVLDRFLKPHGIEAPSPMDRRPKPHGSKAQAPRIEGQAGWIAPAAQEHWVWWPWPARSGR